MCERGMCEMLTINPPPRLSRRRRTRGRVSSLLVLTIGDITTALDAGVFTSQDLVKAYLSRIEEVNDDLRAVTEVNPDAVAIAAGLDAERAKGNIRG